MNPATLLLNVLCDSSIGIFPLLAALPLMFKCINIPFFFIRFIYSFIFKPNIMVWIKDYQRKIRFKPFYKNRIATYWLFVCIERIGNMQNRISWMFFFFQFEFAFFAMPMERSGMKAFCKCMNTNVSKWACYTGVFDLFDGNRTKFWATTKFFSLAAGALKCELHLLMSFLLP